MLRNVETEDLMRELSSRFTHAQDSIKGINLLRHGIEDRDWSKVEEAARQMGVHWFRRKQPA